MFREQTYAPFYGDGMTLFAVVFSVFAGVCMGIQSPTNTELSRHIGNFQATSVSFGGGVVILFFAMLFIGEGSLAGIADASWWQLIGGLYGVCMVLVITFAVPLLGIALTITFIMLGQMFIGMVIDGFGLLLVEQSEVSPARIVGCIIVTAGIFLVCRGRLQNGNKVRMDFSTMMFSVFSFAAGIGGGIQAPTNAALASHVGTVEASFISFCGGFILIFTVTLLTSRGKFIRLKGSGVRPWMMTGGLYGSIAVLAGIIATPVTGVALAMACTLLGQLACGIAVDSTGILRSEKMKMNGWRYAGVIVILIGITVFTYGRYV